ncbi:MAG TPA: HEAT repeat domain-containing protein [Ktedonobacteraceae bacterium]|nr:HEAT repeat domain-containing protein [Ktedonobacteraceae bacterium]
MPRKKRPPQDSIDSILLAISRREDIDPDTMSHYLARLDEEWTDGARDKVLHLLRSSDAMAHAAAVLILTELATDFDLEELEDFVTDPTVSDMAKLSLAPILKELDSEIADEGIVEYLNDPATAIQQMQTRLLELVGQSEMGAESILEDVIAMPTERRLAFVNWLGGSNDPRAASLLIPLLENQPSKVAQVIIDALEQLGPVAAYQTIPALNYLIATNSNRQLKQHARAALGRLTMLSALGVEDAAMTKARLHQLPEYQARVSSIDGSGAQLIMLSWQRPDGGLKGINVLYQDQVGIKDCYGIDEMDMDRWEHLADELKEQGLGCFEVSFEYARAVIMEARAINKRTRHRLPIAYSIWRPFIEVEGFGKKNANATPTMVALPDLNPETIALAQRGDELYQLPEFMWMYEPAMDLEPYITRYWVVSNGFELAPERRGRRGKQREQEKQVQLEELTGQALAALVDGPWRTLYQTRLRRQAYLLQYIGRKEDAELAAAVAAVLDPASPVPIQEQAFPRAMIRFSIEQGPLRIMVDAFESGNFGPFPIKFLGE